MKAIRVHQTGGPEVMQIEDVPTPEPGQGKVLVKIAAARVNFIDIYHRIDRQLPLADAAEAHRLLAG